jgi:hypothetical protein
MDAPVKEKMVLADDELLLRQIPERDFDPETRRIKSIAFVPRKVDKGNLSVDRADLCTRDQSFSLYTRNFRQPPMGTVGVLAGECHALGTGEEVRARPDPIGRDNPAHAVIDFSNARSQSAIRQHARKLRLQAQLRGWLFPPEAVGKPFSNDDDSE